MRILIRMSTCTYLSKLKLTQPGMLWLEHSLHLSATLRRMTQSTGVKSRVHPTLRAFVSALPCSPVRGFSVLCPHTCTGRARTLSHTPVAFASSSAASTPTPAGSLKTQTDTERSQTPTTVPPEDVKRILRLAHPERWRLSGNLSVHVSVSPLYM